MLDGYDREIDYLRISVTDKCNLRCRYCMPEDIEAVAMSEILTFEEIIEIVSIAAELGIKKIKLTGGEPLIRRKICNLAGMLKAVRGIEQVTLTTNGILLPGYIDDLKEAGIDGINVSLDTLDKERYRKLTGYDELNRVSEGISAVLSAGIPLKLNAVSIDPGEPDRLRDACALIEFVKNRAVDIRFIELMPIGFGRGFQGIPHDVLIPSLMKKYGEMARDEEKHGNGPAVYYRIPGYEGRIGFISALHEMFCDDCNRIRLTTKGYLKSCLCYDTGVDLREILRGGISGTKRREKIRSGIERAISNKPKAHCFLTKENISEKNPMSLIGG